MIKVLVFGAGWLGGHYVRYFSAPERRGEYQISATLADITNRLMVRKELAAIRPTVVINAAGKPSGTNTIDWCESNRMATFGSNVEGPRVLSEECRSVGVKLVHLSTGDIFDGCRKEYTEEDEPLSVNRLSYYAVTKILAERILSEFPAALILRLRMPVSDEIAPRNLVTKLARYKEIAAVTNSVTVMDSLMTATEELIRRDAQGIFHVVNPGPVTNVQIREAYDCLVDSEHRGNYRVISAEQLRTSARRVNCVLSTAKLETAGILLPPAMDAIEQVLRRYAKNFRQAALAR